MSAAAGAIALTLTSSVLAPIAAVILVGGMVSIALDMLDKRYQLTDKLIAELESISEKINKEAEKTKDTVIDTLGRSVDGFLRSQGANIPSF